MAASRPFVRNHACRSSAVLVLELGGAERVAGTTETYACSRQSMGVIDVQMCNRGSAKPVTSPRRGTATDRGQGTAGEGRIGGNNSNSRGGGGDSVICAWYVVLVSLLPTLVSQARMKRSHDTVLGCSNSNSAHGVAKPMSWRRTGKRRTESPTEKMARQQKGMWRIPDQHQVSTYPSSTGSAMLLTCKARVNLIPWHGLESNC